MIDSSKRTRSQQDSAQDKKSQQFKLNKEENNECFVVSFEHNNLTQKRINKQDFSSTTNDIKTNSLVDELTNELEFIEPENNDLNSESKDANSGLFKRMVRQLVIRKKGKLVFAYKNYNTCNR